MNGIAKHIDTKYFNNSHAGHKESDTSKYTLYVINLFVEQETVSDKNSWE